MLAAGFAVLSFVALNIVVAVTARHWDSNYLLTEDINEGSWTEGADILFLGDSRTHQGLIPAVMETALAEDGIEASAMNLARPGQQTPFFYYISKRVADEAETKPKVVLLNMSFYMLGGRAWLNDVYFSYYRPSVEEAMHTCEMGLQTCWKSLEWFVRTRFPLWTHRARVNSFTNEFLRDPAKMTAQIAGIQTRLLETDFSLVKGYLSRGYEHITDADVKPGIYKVGVEKGYDIYFDYLRLMIDQMKSQGIEIFVYEFPWPKARETEDGFKDILAYYEDLLDDKSGDSIHFLPTVRYWPNELFVDAQHVNHPGAVRLTEELADELAANPDFRRLFP